MMSFSVEQPIPQPTLYVLLKIREDANLVSSCMILIRGDEKLAMGDCAINVSYEDKLDDQGNRRTVLRKAPVRT